MSRPVPKIENAGRQNSLGLTSSALNTLFDKIEKEPSRDTSSRIDSRWPFRKSSVLIQVMHPGGSMVDVRMACRNLSKSGAGFLHSSFVYTGTRCICVLPHPDHGDTPVEGEFVRCQHRSGVIHEVGVRFDDEIDVRAFVNPDPVSQLFTSERIDPTELGGTILLVEPNRLDSTLFMHHLKETRIEVVPAKTAKEALAAVHGGVDLIISEFALEDMAGSEFALQLRSENISKPLIFLSHDTGPRVVNSVKRKLAQAMIRKPVTSESLLPAIAEFMDSDAIEAAVETTVDPQLIESLKPEIARCAAQLEVALKENKPIEIIGTCHVLQQVSGVIGLTRLSEDVGTVISEVSKSMNLTSSAGLISLVLEQCKRAA